MVLKILGYNTFDIIIKKEYLEIDINIKEEIEEKIKEIFKKIKKIYKIEIEGFYNIEVYSDKNYGVIFHIKKEQLEYYDYFKGQIDMRLIINDTTFYYEVDDIILEDKTKIHIKDNRIYLEIIKPLTKKEMMYLQENVRDIVFNW